MAEVEQKAIEKKFIKKGDLTVLCGGKSAPVTIRNALKIYEAGEFMERHNIPTKPELQSPW